MEKLKTELPDVELASNPGVSMESQEVKHIVLPDDFNIYSGGHYDGDIFIYDKPIGPVKYNQASRFYCGHLVAYTEKNHTTMYILAIFKKANQEAIAYKESHNCNVGLINGPHIPRLCTQEYIDSTYK